MIAFAKIFMIVSEIMLQVLHIAKIKVRFLTSLRALVGQDEIEFEVSDPYTIGDLLKEMTTRYGLKFRELMEKGSFEGYVPGEAYVPMIIVNHCSVSLEKDLNKRLNDGDEVTLLPAMGGG